MSSIADRGEGVDTRDHLCWRGVADLPLSQCGLATQTQICNVRVEGREPSGFCSVVATVFLCSVERELDFFSLLCTAAAMVDL